MKNKLRSHVLFLFPKNVNFPPSRGDTHRVFSIARMTLECGLHSSVFYLSEGRPFKLSSINFYPIRGKITADPSIAKKQSVVSAGKDLLYFSAMILVFARRISKKDKTILYAHTPVGGLVGLIVKLFTNLELVYDPHDWFYETWAFSHRNLNNMKRAFIYLFYKASALVMQLIPEVFVCVSHSMLDAIKTRHHKVLIPNTLEEPNQGFKKIAQEKKGTVLFVGHVAAYQGVLNLIKAFSTIERKLKNTALFIVGDGEDLQQAKRLSEKLGIRKITFTGPVSHDMAYSFISKAEVCVAPFIPLPLINTSSPIKLLEYAAFDKKIVTTDMRSLRTMMAGYSKTFFAQANPESLAETIELALRKESSINVDAEGIYVRNQHKQVQKKICSLYEFL